MTTFGAPLDCDWRVTIRVLLGPMPGVLRDILEKLLGGHDDLQLVGICNSVPELREAVVLHSPDVVVVGTGRSDWIGEFVELFRSTPDLRLLAIRDDARSAAMHELRVRRCRVTDLAPTAILNALRASCDEIEESRSTSL